MGTASSKCMTLLLASVLAASAPAIAVEPESPSRSPSKAVAPVDVRLAALDPVHAGVPLRLRLEAVPRVDAPLLKLAWLLPQGVLLESGNIAWSGPASAGTMAELVVTVRLADLAPRTLLAGATIQYPDGSRQVKAASLSLPSGGPAKAPPSPPVTRTSRGRAIVEHLVKP